MVRRRAGRLVAAHPLRAADALQLAAALVWCEEQPAGEAFVCAGVESMTRVPMGGFNPLSLGCMLLGQVLYVYLLDPATGKPVWQYQTGGQILQTAAYQDGVIFFDFVTLMRSLNQLMDAAAALLPAPRREDVAHGAAGSAGRGPRHQMAAGAALLLPAPLGLALERAVLVQLGADGDVVHAHVRQLGVPQQRDQVGVARRAAGDAPAALARLFRGENDGMPIRTSLIPPPTREPAARSTPTRTA